MFLLLSVVCCLYFLLPFLRFVTGWIRWPVHPRHYFLCLRILLLLYVLNQMCKFFLFLFFKSYMCIYCLHINLQNINTETPANSHTDTNTHIIPKHSDSVSRTDMNTHHTKAQTPANKEIHTYINIQTYWEVINSHTLDKTLAIKIQDWPAYISSRSARRRNWQMVI